VTLTTTGYAILGHLAMQPWTMYDLAAQMRRNVHFFFPRAESQIYEEPKRLVALGLATATQEANGRRPRTVYAITEAGRAEVASRADDLQGIEEGLADSVRLIADEVRGSVREAMKSLRADLAAASKQERASAKTAPKSADDDVRVRSREQLHRADALVSEFRARVRSDLRSHVARGGELAASVVNDLERALEEAAHAITRAIQR